MAWNIIKRGLIIIVLLLLLLIFPSCGCAFDSPEYIKTPLHELSDTELKNLIDDYYEHGTVWASHKAIIYQNELILRKLDKKED